MKESISALMDAELTESECARVLEEFARDSDLRKVWERYHIIRAALAKDLGPVMPANLSDRIAERLCEFPAPTASRVTWLRRWQPAARWAGNLALAASVAVVAILAAQWFVQYESKDTSPQIAARPDERGEHLRTGIRWDTGKPEVAKRLNTYLVEHHEFTPTSSMNGVMSYGRFVVYDNNP